MLGVDSLTVVSSFADMNCERQISAGGRLGVCSPGRLIWCLTTAENCDGTLSWRVLCSTHPRKHDTCTSTMTCILKKFGSLQLEA